MQVAKAGSQASSSASRKVKAKDRRVLTTAVVGQRRVSQEEFKTAGSKKAIQTESRVALRRVSNDKPLEIEVQSKTSEAVVVKCKSLSPKVPQPRGRNEKMKKAQDLVALNKKLTGMSLVEGAGLKQAESTKRLKLLQRDDINFQQEYQEFLQSNNNTEREQRPEIKNKKIVKVAKAANGPHVRILGRTFNPSSGPTAEQKKVFSGSVKLIKGPNDMTQITVGASTMSVRKFTTSGNAPTLAI